MEFAALLALIDDRGTAFRAALGSAPSLEAPVPSCPEWTLWDLALHLGRVQRYWAATVDAGPAAADPPESAAPTPSALLAWSAESTGRLLEALREAGPDRGCHTWWGESESPETSGAVARHQVQEAMVHTYDAQLSQGAAQPLPVAAALDGVDEFLSTCCATTIVWPHQPAVIDFQATEGRSWRLVLTADGVRTARPDTVREPDAALRGTAAELVLALYGRLPIASLPLEGDRQVVEQLRDWDPDA